MSSQCSRDRVTNKQILIRINIDPLLEIDLYISLVTMAYNYSPVLQVLGDQCFLWNIKLSAQPQTYGDHQEVVEELGEFNQISSLSKSPGISLNILCVLSSNTIL